MNVPITFITFETYCMKKAVKIFFIVTMFAITLSCGQGRGGRETGASGADAAAYDASGYRAFPRVQVPTVCGDQESAAQFLAVHYWDAYFTGLGKTDTSATLGVKNRELEKAFADYVGMLDYVSMADAQEGIINIFERVSAIQQQDTTSHIYTVFAQMAEKYLYDPNSPLRNEDYFLPYVSSMAISKLTKEELRPSYEYQTKMCCLNRAGTVAPDFSFCTGDGKIKNLHAIQAQYIILFFSNPGCNACQEIIDALTSIPDVENLVKTGKIAIVNIYIDEELQKWFDYLPNYPDYWICGYDFNYIIRKDILYNVRAIPSLYLLDAEKRVVCKDAPTEKLINTLGKRLCQ